MPHHLLTVWNPSYASDALDAHLRVLLQWAERSGRGEADLEDVYVWWAKLRSKNRTGALPHGAEVLALQEQIDAGVETHLYLTDFRSLYVGHLAEITSDDLLRTTPGEADHAPEYYSGMHADVWFRLWDIRRIVSEDTLGVIEELKKLQNKRYYDRPVSLYGGMVELPLIVSSKEEPAWFADVDILTGGELWAVRDAHLRAESQRLARELPQNLFGRAVWSAFESATRTFLASAEAVFRARRDDPGFDFSGPAIEYAKAVETELNALVFPPLSRLLATRPPAEREVLVEGHRIDLGGRVPHQSLGAIRTLLKHNDIVRKHLTSVLPADGRWLLGEVLHYLAPIVELRNPAAHSHALRRGEVEEFREQVLGIGQEGLLVRLARAKLRGVRHAS